MGENAKKYLSKFMWDNLRDSMIVYLTENKLLQQVQNIELINWKWFGIHCAAQRKPLSKNVQLRQYLAMKLFFISQFQVAHFAFSILWETLL